MGIYSQAAVSGVSILYTPLVYIAACFRCYCTFVPPSIRVRATVKLSAAFFHDESSITIGGGRRGYESAIAPFHPLTKSSFVDSNLN